MYICLFEDEHVDNLRPLTDTRPAWDLRIGGRILGEQARSALVANHVLGHCRPEVAAAAARLIDGPVNHVPGSLGVLFVNGRAVLRTGAQATQTILAHTEATTSTLFMQRGVPIAAWVTDASLIDLSERHLSADSFDSSHAVEVEGVSVVARPWELLDEIGPSLLEEFAHHSRGFNILERPRATLHDSTILVEDDQVFVAPDATIKPCCVIDASGGPVVIERGATVHEFSVLKGPIHIGEQSQVKVGANLQNVAIGPRCKVAGEVHDTIFQSYANKAHDGFLGNAWIGSWCNLGAATNNSNLKNDYGSVRLYNPATGKDEDSGRQFVGLFMGDHSKCGIGTTFNTGSVIGVACNLFGSGFHERFVPSFCWGGPAGYTTYRLDKALGVARRVMKRRDIEMTEADMQMLRHVFDASRSERSAFLERSA